MSIQIPLSTPNNPVEPVITGKPAEPDVAKKALERLSMRREEMRKRIGTVEIAVDLVRESRDA